MTRLDIQKTYKLYIGGKFPRTESGRYYQLIGKDGKALGNICLGSRKDLRNAVVAARNGYTSWSKASPFNRSQVIYRIAEMLEARKGQFRDELVLQASTIKQADAEIQQTIDSIIHYAGWCDKYQQVFSSVNTVSSPHFNFSVPEPMGVVVIVAPITPSLSGLVHALMPVIAGGNSAVVIASELMPLCAVSFAEVLHTSDVPSGVVNILTGKTTELIHHAASHMDVNAIVYQGEDAGIIKTIQETAATNIKRTVIYEKPSPMSPYAIMDTQEIKTTWHPVEEIG